MKARDYILLGFILLAALGLRLWGIDYGLPYRYFTEEYKVIHYALKMGGGDLNPHFFEYPSLYLYFMLFVYGCFYGLAKLFGVYQNTHDFALSFVRDPSAVYLLSRIMEMLWGLALIVIVFFVAKKWFGKKSAYWAALFTAVLSQFVFLGHATKGDTLAICLCLLALHLSLQIADTGRFKFYLLNGVILGLACSTKYYAGPMIALMPLAHGLNLKSQKSLGFRQLIFSKKLWLCFVLIPIVFFLGSPYALIDFSTFLRDVRNIRFSWLLASANLNWQDYLGVFRGWVELSGSVQGGAPWLGFFCLGAIFWHFRIKTKYLSVWLSPIVLYTLSIIQTPMAWGYMLPIFPIFLILGGRFLGQTKVFSKIAPFLGSALALGCLARSLFIDYGLAQKDTRTQAKEWIEINIPSGSKILMGKYPSSPPLAMSLSQLERLYERAVDLKHHKQEYLRLQIEAHPGPEIGYEIFTLRIEPEFVGTLPHLAQEAQQMQDLLPYDKGLDFLREQGAQYVVINSLDEDEAVARHDKDLASFYKELYQKGSLLKRIKPQSKWQRGPRISVFKL